MRNVTLKNQACHPKPQMKSGEVEGAREGHRPPACAREGLFFQAAGRWCLGFSR